MNVYNLGGNVVCMSGVHKLRSSQPWYSVKLDQLSGRKYNFFKKVTKYVSIYIDSKVQLPECAFFNAIFQQVDYKVSLCSPRGCLFVFSFKRKIITLFPEIFKLISTNLTFFFLLRYVPVHFPFM